ncbi:Vegetative incompatibility protein HET-E-1-like protein 15 [Paraphaeosphaeria sporulosa]
MRLLQYSENGELSIHSFDDGAIPPYAILSHTWGADGDEVTFADLETGGGRTKPGYKKIVFCGKQARHDGFQYFWIDTCCINKTDKAELAFAIRSMFRWYRNAARCYVYLSDVSNQPMAIDRGHSNARWFIWIWMLPVLCSLSGWCNSMIYRFLYSRHISCPFAGGDVVYSQQESKSALWSSRWFTRGWTLQELLAPSTVDFFSKEGIKLGDKLSLAGDLRKATGIPTSALQGEPLSNFRVHERIEWSEHRTTKIPADRAYSLMGILGVSLSPIDSESPAEAMKRVIDEVEKQNKCVQDLRSSNPRDDKTRIEQTKGGLLADAYRWVLDNDTFQQWQQDSESRLLWVKGDPGKGKTMLLCGIIDKLHNSLPKNALLAYFFCQATDSRINTATAVLRGLLYMLVSQEPSLASHIRNGYDRAGKALFEDANAWVALTAIFADVLRDPQLRNTYLIIDALDECVTDQSKLLDFVAKQSSASHCAKWIVASRNWPDIEEQLELAERKTRLSLELNAESVAAAVRVFIQQKVDQLAKEKRYKPETKDAVLQHLMSNANDTFLWVALVCQNLQWTPKWNVLQKLAHFPPGLDSLYERMMDQISASDSASIFLRVLAVTAVLYRPVTITELVALIEQLEDVDDFESVQEIIGLCGSFLTLREDTIYFVHQSAKDFLITKAFDKIFPDGVEQVHWEIYLKSLTILSRTLHRDLYGLEAPGSPIKNVEPPDPDPLAASRYPCIYWINHLCDSTSLASKDTQDQDELTQLVHDARRFIMYHQRAIESFPLQTYASALLFSPTASRIRQLFQHEEPGITIKPGMSDSWSACLQTLEGHSGGVISVAFSPDSTQLASASSDTTVKIWEVSNGACLQTLEGHSGGVISVAFSSDSTRLASASEDTTVKIWEVSSGACLQTLEGHSGRVLSVAFSPDSTWLASASDDTTVKIWEVSSGACLQTLEGHSGGVISVAFSPDATPLASASGDTTVKSWEVSSGACLQTLKGHSGGVYSVAFSPDSTQLASASDDTMVKSWEVSSGACLQTLEGHSGGVYSVAFSPDSTQLASASDDTMVKIWEVSSGACLQTLEGHSGGVWSVAFSPDSTWLASASSDTTVKIWEASSGACLQTLKGHSGGVTSVAFSPDSTWLASASGDTTVKIWEVSSGACLQTLEGHSDWVLSVAFSPDSTRLASASGDTTVKIWEVSSGACLQTLEGHSGGVISVAFSADSTWLASASDDTTVKIWEVSSGACLQTLEGNSGYISSADLISIFASLRLRTAEPQQAIRQGIAISSDSTWISDNAQNMLWLPTEYRPSSLAISSTSVGFGTGSGKVWVCRFT